MFVVAVLADKVKGTVVGIVIFVVAVESVCRVFVAVVGKQFCILVSRV